MPRLLEVRDLVIEYTATNGPSPALNGITFHINPGEVLGILGESGSGKTTLGLAVLRLLPPNARIVQGSILFRDRDLARLDERELQKFRGSEVAMTFQEPELALNPLMRALDQVEEVIRAHRRWSRGRRREEARKVLCEVGLHRNPRLLSAYAHELSGGERQRLVIAQAIACRPALLIADEPCISLDVILQSEWLALMKDLCKRLELALILITHDPAILAGFATRVLVIYQGTIIEEAGYEEMVRQPLHPYTQALLGSIPPPAGAATGRKRLPVIVPGPTERIAGRTMCPFEPRCPDRFTACAHQLPPEATLHDQRRVRCLKYGERSING